MPQPWLKKNPFMSMWLSAANRAAGLWHGQASAQAKRHATAAVTDATTRAIQVWSDALKVSKAKSAAKRKR
ncbi:MAG: hypothetical protein A2711_04410 [Burkholderiales bacterium RIFCSPHIGHO2_01_FULL_63_240]|jgi:hypothetical protein|nr:MAG: hypothetical protein A2711_04410 [Burkholderiales bacterium RIFCSPHIGHO2_01_FULL_63_240]